MMRDTLFFRCPISTEVIHEVQILSSKTKMQNSLALFSKEETYLLKCTHCGKTFSRRSELATHLSKIHSNNVFHCEPCDTLFHHNKSLFVDHMKWHQQTSLMPDSSSSLDKKTYNYQSKVKSLKKKESNKNSTSESNNLEQNIKTVKKELSAPYPCKDCGQIFQILSRYNKHIIGHKSSPTINCDSESEDDISEEQEFDVKEGVLYQCEECGKSFKLKESYKSHLRRHTGEKPYTCHVCGKRFAHNGGLSYHLKHVHMGIKDHGCDICGRSFAMKAAMEDHRRIHTGERPYVCHSCGKSFKTKASLYIHSKTHTDEFPHPCTYCHRRFRWKQQLLGHLTTHTGERNHTCDVCGKRFGVKNDLTRHKRVHSDTKPFSCPVCAFPFAQKRYLKNHMKARHKMKYVDSNSGPGN